MSLVTFLIFFGIASSVAGGGSFPTTNCGGLFRPCKIIYEPSPDDAIIISAGGGSFLRNVKGWGTTAPPKFRTTPGWTTTTQPTPPPPPTGWGAPEPTPPNQVDLFKIVETCSANFITQDYKEGWENVAETIFFDWDLRLASKLHVYLMAHNLYQTNGFRDFREEHFKQSCSNIDRLNEWVVTNTTGFGKWVNLKMDKTSTPKLYRFRFHYGPDGASAGTASVIFSDSKTFTAFEFCLDNGLRTFAVYTSRDFQDSSLKSIYDHLRSLGFKQHHMIDLNPREECISFRGELLPNIRNGGNFPIPGPPKINNLALLRGVAPASPYFFKKK